MEKLLPAIPTKRYFTIGEVSDLCGVKPYVLRYWEQEFSQLKPMKRRGNRRYYQHHEVLLIRRIRDLLYDQGFTISGARNQLGDLVSAERSEAAEDELDLEADLAAVPAGVLTDALPMLDGAVRADTAFIPLAEAAELQGPQLRAELLSIRELLSV